MKKQTMGITRKLTIMDRLEKAMGSKIRSMKESEIANRDAANEASDS